MDGNLNSWMTYIDSILDTNYSDPPYVAMSATFVDTGVWHCNNETMSSSVPYTFGQDSSFLCPLESGSNIDSGDVVADSREWDALDQTMSRSVPFTFAQDSDILLPVEGLSNIYGHGVATSANVNVSLQSYQDVPLSGTNVNIKGNANWTNMDDTVHQVEGSLQTNQAVVLQATGRQLAEGISIARADFQHRSNLKRNSMPRVCRHSQTAVSIMRNWFKDHLSNPYPRGRELFQLSERTGLGLQQVDTWFGNEREKYRKKGRSIGVKLKEKNGHPDSAIQVLKEWVGEHLENPKPTTKEKTFLAQKAKLTLQQVSYWFENYRNKKKRQLQPQKKDRRELMDVSQERRLCISDMDAQDPGETAEVQQQFGLVFQPELDKGSNHSWDIWDEGELLSCLNARGSCMQASSIEFGRDCQV